MGEVYLARDSKLERTVALKILPPEVAGDSARMRRFVQEARAASQLSHPNVAHIYEIEEEAGTRFIAMEYVEGKTLRQQIGRGRLDVTEALDVVIQVASALAAAHEAGIVHRDIKPENVMIRRDAIVKVLDFGLAKLSEQTTMDAVDTEAATRARVNTEPGVVMGTVTYMSPEQARGLEVDARSDIWSLGVLLYECVAGVAPFTGPTPTDIIASIVKTTPAPLTRLVPEAPVRLEEITAKALEKDREERYQGVKDLLVDLRRLKKRMEFEAEMGRSVAPDSHSAPTVIIESGGAQPSVPSAQTVSAPLATQPQQNRSTSSAEYIAGEIKRHKIATVVALLIALALISGAGFLLYKVLVSRWKTETTSAPSFQSMKVTRLTTSGKVTGATISPDGRYLAYVNEEAGQQSIWLKQIKTGSLVQIVPPGQSLSQRVTFSRDGEYIYYRVIEREKEVNTLYEVPSLGGTPRKVLFDIDTTPTFSPDGTRMAFVRHNNPVEGMSRLIIASADGTNEKVLVERNLKEAFNIPAWSPDGKEIAAIISQAPNIGDIPLVLISVADGAVRSFGQSHWARVNYMAWLPDKSGLLLTARDNSSTVSQIWFVAYPSGEVRRVTNDLNNYGGMSVTNDGTTMAALQSVTQSDLWLAPEGKAGSAQQITLGSGTATGSQGVSFMPDGRLIYSSNSGGNDDIWIAGADGKGARQLTSNARRNLWPTATPDGRYIVFSSDRTGKFHLWRMDADGGNPLQLTDGSEGDFYTSVSPDGRWVVYNAFDERGLDALFKVSINGGASQRLSETYAFAPSVSPDGKQIACFFYESSYTQVHVGVLPFEGGQITFVKDLPASAFSFGLSSAILKWTPDGKGIAFVNAENGVYNLREIPVAGGEMKQLTDFKSGTIFWFAWSKDGKQLALARGQRVGDAVMFSNFK
ncbi:MAG: PD40 domain-containing protein [Pyrinomonadaceae bacterium]|nr:PD40 domain-containing protein [Pyrinomonadaceae bacterium]